MFVLYPSTTCVNENTTFSERCYACAHCIVAVAIQTMSTDEALLAEMYGEIVNTHYNLRGINPRVAELQFIIEAQQLDGYGLDYFNAKVRTRTSTST